jgi:hypothetical protein
MHAPHTHIHTPSSSHAHVLDPARMSGKESTSFAVADDVDKHLSAACEIVLVHVKGDCTDDIINNKRRYA